MKFICPHCHSEFYLLRGLLLDYVYKIKKPLNPETRRSKDIRKKMTYYCSYTCWRAQGGDK